MDVHDRQDYAMTTTLIEVAPSGFTPFGVSLDEEVEDLVQLLMEHATHPGILSDHLARALAVACMI